MRQRALRSTFVAAVLMALSPPAAALAVNPLGGSDWAANAKAFRGQNGLQVDFTCPAGGGHASVWGTTLYTDDSSVCNAAVHSGKITYATGGTVTIEIRPGESSYSGSSSNGITTSSYGPWSGSYVLAAVSRGSFTGWSFDARTLRGLNGQSFRYTCPAGGRLSTIWGAGVYTDDSSVCVAAVHAGLITMGHGGSVTITIKSGLASYRGTTSHGVTSRPYGRWSGSYTFAR